MLIGKKKRCGRGVESGVSLVWAMCIKLGYTINWGVYPNQFGYEPGRRMPILTENS